ncbi:hypothetical protein BaRGS_00004539 [Batillaria attramentaria]|uniref:Uncharacterized protein n=1 Tax=Batillaria attramentaria TaxID=370345 RepID=A0ABD0LXI4_9CAEN
MAAKHRLRLALSALHQRDYIRRRDTLQALAGMPVYVSYGDNNGPACVTVSLGSRARTFRKLNEWPSSCQSFG